MKTTRLLILFIATQFLTFAFAQGDTVDGYVFLADSLESGGTHEDVQVTFYHLPSMEMETFGLSNEDGYYSFSVAPGFYTIEWAKDGYVPWELGGVTMGAAGDVTLEDVSLVPGEVITVTGEQSGSWTTSNQYWVDGEITVPEGETLTIDAGVRVKFLAGAGMVCNGTLQANGTEDEHVLFTSKQPTPLPGDWDNIELYGENNIISYVDYEYATDGFSGDGTSGSTFDNLTMLGTLSLTANGIYLTNSSNMTFTNNQITVAGNEILYCSEAANSTFSGNVLSGTGRGIYANNAAGSTITNNEINTSGSDGFEMDYCHNCLFDGNTVTMRPTIGIEARYSDSLTVTNNNLDVYQYGMSMHDGSNYTIENNLVTEFEEHGIYFRGSENSVVENNRLISSYSGGYKRGIDNNASSQAAVINNNYVLVQIENMGNERAYGIISHDSEIISNTVLISIFENIDNSRSHDDALTAIRADRSVVQNNQIEVYGNNYDETHYGIEGYGSVDNRCYISSNTILSDDNTRGIWASYADILDNIITGVNNNQWSIGHGASNVITGNTITNMSYGIQVDGQSDNVIDGNSIQVSGTGINGSNANNLTVTNNTIETNNGTVIYTSNGLSNIKYNLLISNSGRGIHCENQAGEEFSNNTIIGSGGDYGVYIADLSAPIVRNNIIQGFQNGIYDDNALANYNLAFNNFWEISGSLFEGTNLPAIIGEMITANANADPSDIYNNISFDPVFVAPGSGDYSLQVTSPCINAGDPSTTDPDGTVADIGAFYYHVYVIVDHTPLGITSDTQGPYTVTAVAYSPAGNAVNANLLYRVNGGDFMELVMTDLGNDNFTADIPGQAMNSQIDYYILVSDGENVATDPPGAPEETHTFTVTLMDELTILSGYSRPDGTIDLYWDEPLYLDGVAPTSLSIYRSGSPGVTQDDLIAELDLSESTYHDSVITEGNTYYYKLGLTAEAYGETYILFISNEAPVLSNPEDVVSVSGQVLLEGTDDNSGVLIEFHRTNPTENYYTTTTVSNGSFEKEIPLGIYNISFAKEGWQPYELNNQYITEPTQYEPITLEQGYPAYVQGDVSGTWTKEYLYFIMGDITVPEGETLAIEAGTRIKFTGEYQFTVEGVLQAEGDSLNHVEFISGNTIPQPGDWGILSLHSPGNILRYVDIRYAGNGISGGDIDGSVFDHCSIAEIPYWADDTRINCHGIEAENCVGCVFSNNSVEGDIWEGIMVEHDGSGSVFTGNMINTHEAMMGLGVGEGDNLIFSNNTVMAEGYGASILVEEGSNISITDNIITGYKGIQVPFGENLNISGNDITSTNRGVHITTSGTNLTLTDNTISSGERSIYASGIEDGEITGNSCEGSSGNWAIDMSSCNDCLFEANTVNYPSGHGIISNSSSTTTMENNTINIGGYGMEVASGNSLEITNNAITGFNSYGIRFESTSNTSIHNNSLVSTPNGDSNNYGIYNGNTSSSGNVVYTNDIHFLNADNTVEGIRASNADVYDNSITIDNGGSDNYGIRGDKNTIYNNMITQTSHSNGYAIYNSSQYSSSEIYGNQIELSGASGIKGNLLHIHDNTMTGSGAIGIDITGNQDEVSTIEDNIIIGKVQVASYAVIDMHHNLVISTTGGLEIYNMAGGHFYNNTFTGNGSGTGLYIHDFGLEASGQTLKVENNIFSGFDTGVNLASVISSIQFNNISNSTSQDFTGAGLPQVFGAVNVSNANGDLGDFYANLFINPEFVLPDSGNFNLQTISPCIDAGNFDMDGDGINYQNDEDDQDPDGTAFDIGAFYRSINDTTDVFGCTDNIACNYIPGATQDNGGCTYPTTWYWDEDGDGLGVEESQVDSCDDEVPPHFVDNADDLEPDCDTNDTDECEICGGGNADMDCNGDCFGTALDDSCGVCSGGLSEHEANSNIDCNGDCFGEAYLDGCSDCVGGSTGLEECPADCTGLDGGTAILDECGVCSGGTTEHEANSDMDCGGVCFGDSVLDSFDGCCFVGSIDDCGQCDGNGWDMCDDDDDGTPNYEQWGYGAHDLDIVDVAGDQGGWVNVTFQKSFYDTDTLRSVESYTVEANYGSGWINSANGTAYGSDQYTYQVHTQIDSSTASDGIIDFRIIAGMEEGNFVSEIDSGYSVDNLAPSVPTGLMVSLAGSVELEWNDVSDNDLYYYNIYRNSELIGQAAISSFMDENPLLVNSYNITAIDINENESELSASIEAAIMLGDVNIDGVVDVSDAVIMIELILYEQVPNEIFDMNYDGWVDVLDLIIVIEFIIGPNLSRGESTLQATLFYGNGMLYYESDGNIAGIQLIVSGNYEVVHNNLAPGWELAFNKSNIIMYSLNGSSLDDRLLIEYTGELTIESAIVADWYESDISVNSIILPSEYILSSAYPNPFNPTTTLSFALPIQSDVTITIYNMQGRQVSTLIDGNMEAGYHSVVWNADAQASGVYFVKMMTSEFTKTQKLMLVK